VAKGTRKIIYAELAANAAMAAAKLAVGLVVGSVAMLAEAAHSFADTVNQGFLLISLNLSDEPADEEHPFGHGKDRFFWAFLTAVFIFVAGAVFSVYEGTRQLTEGGAHEGNPWPGYLVLGLGFLFDGSVFVVSIREMAHRLRTEGIGLLQFLRESPDVTLKTALFEDAAALIGVAIAATGLYLADRTGSGVYDGIASILIGSVLIAVAGGLGLQARDLLLGAAAPPRVQEAIRQSILGCPHVRQIGRLLTMQLGTGSLLVTGSVDVDGDLRADQLEGLLRRLDERIRTAAPEAKNIYLVPRPSLGGS
jgi:cation diffusion facilitator family transporter